MPTLLTLCLHSQTMKAEKIHQQGTLLISSTDIQITITNLRKLPKTIKSPKITSDFLI